MSQNKRSPLIQNHNVMHRIALFAALLAWCAPAAAQSVTGWPLAGVHLTQTCATCHKTMPYKTAATTCVGCHMNDYNTAKTPVDHIASNFPTTCDSCHKFSDPTWLVATFSHSTFALVGLHATTPCATCHNPPYAPSANNYTTVPTTCYGCHLRDFTGATTPVSHTGFPTTCDSCHKNTDTTWSQKGSFVHNAYFALAGAHVTAPCSQCHNPPYAPSANNYISVPTSPCSSCHLKDYNTATTPVNHITAAFPTTCDTCHKFTDATWTLGKFNHTYFPLTSNHNRPCADCHKTASVYTVFTCTDCHTKSSTDSKHKGRAGYVWTSVACYSCHPNGRAG